MRKVVSIVSVCLVCLTLCLYAPINGRAMSFNDEPLRYSVLQFDYIETRAYKIPCPFNFASAGTEREPFNFGDDKVYGFVHSPVSSTYVDGYLIPLLYDEVTFYSSLQVVRLSGISSFYDYFVAAGQDGQRLTGATISCSVVTLNDDWAFSNNVGAAYDDLSARISPNANGTISFSQGLYNLLVNSGYSDADRLLLSDLKITLTYEIDVPDSASLLISSHYTSFNPNLLFGQWVSDQGLSIPDFSGDSGFNLGTWLSNSVNGFLEAEIFPGFSINKIFYIILVVGLLLWFFKIIS